MGREGPQPVLILTHFRAADPTDVRVILDGQQLEALHGYGRVGEIKAGPSPFANP